MFSSPCSSSLCFLVVLIYIRSHTGDLTQACFSIILLDSQLFRVTLLSHPSHPCHCAPTCSCCCATFPACTDSGAEWEAGQAPLIAQTQQACLVCLPGPLFAQSWKAVQGPQEEQVGAAEGVAEGSWGCGGGCRHCLLLGGGRLQRMQDSFSSRNQGLVATRSPS